MKSNRIKAILLFVLGALLCAAFVVLWMGYANSSWDDESRGGVSTVGTIEMNVGEVYDLSDSFRDERGIVRLSIQNMNVYTQSVNANEASGRGVFLDGDGNLHAAEAGVYDLDITVYYAAQAWQEEHRTVVQMKVVVHDYEFGGYTPVRSYADLAQAGAEGGKYILAADFTVDRKGEEASGFSGVLVNPNGCTITLADDQPLFSVIGSGSVVRGLKIKTDADGVTLGDGYAMMSGNGVLASMLNTNGYVCDCSVEGTVYRGRGDGVCGVVLSNMGEIIRCTFRGTLFENGGAGRYYGEVENCAFGISFDGTVRDCAVYADAYRGGEARAAEAFTALHVRDAEDEESLSGNRVFDLSGEHEVDLSKRVDYISCIGNSTNGGSNRMELFAGSVAEWSFDACNYIENAGAEVVSCALNGEEYPAQTLYIPADSSECRLELFGLYTETTVSADGRYLSIHAAEARVQLPDGIYDSSIRMGEFCPAAVTLAFSPQTQTFGDTLFLGSSYADVQLTADISASEIYKERADGNVYRADSGKLCVYRGPVVDGTVTIPEGVTEMSANPFGDLAFTELYTNDLATYENRDSQSTYIDWHGEWMESVVRLRLGSALQFSDRDNMFPRDFPALESIETEPREDGYAAEDGILYKNGNYYFVPPAYAAGETLTLESGNVLRYALAYNRAKEVVFTGTAVIDDEACRWADFTSVVFAGEVTAESTAFYGCNELLTVRAEPNASVTLEDESFYACSALETIVLNEGFDSVAYDAVFGGPSFTGYVPEEGCDKFTVSDGVLFVEGSAQIPAAWGGENLTVPAGIADVRLYKDESYGIQETALGIAILGQDVQSIRAEGVRFGAYEVAAENPYLSSEDGVVFNKDKTRLIVWPQGRTAEFYAVPETVTGIAAYAFNGADIARIECPGVVTVGENAFARSSLAEAVFGDSLRTIGAHAFYQTYSLQSVELGEGLLSIGTFAFGHDDALESIELPAGLEEIGDNAFWESGLTEIVLPHNVSLGSGVFVGTNIASVILPEGVTQIPDSLFSGAGMLAHVELPSTLESIGDYAFDDTALEQISLPEGLKSIGRYAFSGTALEGVALPAALQNVGEYAFYDCRQLASVAAVNPDTLYGAGCFAGTPFLTEGRSAESGGIYLGNTLLALYGGGSTVEVKYGTKNILELRSDAVQVLKIPFTASIPSVTAGDLPVLRELWLGEAPAGLGEELVLGDLRLNSFTEELLVHLPERVRMEGTVGSNVYICYQGTAETFAESAYMPNFSEFYDQIFFFEAESGNRWHYGDGLQIVIERGEDDGFEYTYTYDRTNDRYECTVVGYRGAETAVTIPAYSSVGFPVTAVYDLGKRMSEVRIASKEITFRGALEADRLYIPAGCEVHTIVRNGMDIGTLCLGAESMSIGPGMYIDAIVVEPTVRELNCLSYYISVIYYQGTPEEFAENAPEINVSVDAYYDEDGVYPSDGNAYWHFVDGEPVLWGQSQA